MKHCCDNCRVGNARPSTTHRRPSLLQDFVYPKCNTTLQDALDKAWTSFTGHPIWLQTASAQQPRDGREVPSSFLDEILYCYSSVRVASTSTRHGAFFGSQRISLTDPTANHNAQVYNAYMVLDGFRTARLWVQIPLWVCRHLGYLFCFPT